MFIKNARGHHKQYLKKSEKQYIVINQTIETPVAWTKIINEVMQELSRLDGADAILKRHNVEVVNEDESNIT